MSRRSLRIFSHLRSLTPINSMATCIIVRNERLQKEVEALRIAKDRSDKELRTEAKYGIRAPSGDPASGYERSESRTFCFHV